MDIDAVRGGAILTLSADGDVKTRRYWEPHAAPDHLGKDEAYYIAAYRRVLREAVECRLRRTNAPVGLFMGGGLTPAPFVHWPAMQSQNRAANSSWPRR